MPQGNDQTHKWVDEINAAVGSIWAGYEMIPMAMLKRIIRAQMWQESRGKIKAVSPAGARGLMQIMPGTWEDLTMGADFDEAFDPVKNLWAGVEYLEDQYKHLYEAPVWTTRIMLALAAYNGGRGYINAAMKLARSNGDWEWWSWAVVRERLQLVEVRGKRPDTWQMLEYVRHIAKRAAHYTPKNDPTFPTTWSGTLRV